MKQENRYDKALNQYEMMRDSMLQGGVKDSGQIDDVQYFLNKFMKEFRSDFDNFMREAKASIAKGGRS